MSLKIIEGNQKACYTNKIDNKKIRRKLERENISLINEIEGYYNSNNIPKNRRHERFKIRQRLANKLYERQTNQKLDSKIEFEIEVPPELEEFTNFIINNFSNLEE